MKQESCVRTTTHSSTERSLRNEVWEGIHWPHTSGDKRPWKTAFGRLLAGFVHAIYILLLF